MNHPRFSVVLPCYNESETLPYLFRRFGEVLGDRNDIEVIFVNNGSRDASAEAFAHESAVPGRSWARVINVAVNQGYGYGILAGLRAAAGDFVGWTHADSQYNPQIVVDGFTLLASAADPQRTLVQGARIGRNTFDGFFTAAMTLIASLVLRARVSDINAQPKLFPRALLDAIAEPPHDFSLDLYLLYLARRQRFEILRLPVVFGRRLHGEAKGGGSLRLKWKLTSRTLKYIFELRRRLRTSLDGYS